MVTVAKFGLIVLLYGAAVGGSISLVVWCCR